MKVQINTDDNVQGHEALAERVEAEVESALSRFREDITRVESPYQRRKRGEAWFSR